MEWMTAHTALRTAAWTMVQTNACAMAVVRGGRRSWLQLRVATEVLVWKRARRWSRAKMRQVRWMTWRTKRMVMAMTAATMMQVATATTTSMTKSPATTKMTTAWYQQGHTCLRAQVAV